MAQVPTGKARSAAMLAAALGYARRGWSVIPLRARAKIPAIKWEPYQSRRADAAEIEAWLQRRPGANIGIVTGDVSGLMVLDVDGPHDGEASLKDLEARHGALPATVEAETGGGGRHLYFTRPAVRLRNRAGLAPGLDLRGDGGMVVAPPSIHPSGRPYRWRAGHDPAAMAPAEPPLWLLRLASGEGGLRGHSPEYWRELVRGGVGEGMRNNTVASLAGHLLWHGVDVGVVGELLLCWNRELCRPPLDDGEVLRTVASIARLHAGRAASETSGEA